MAGAQYHSRSSYGWTGSDWAEYHRSARQSVTRRFGGIDEFVEQAFLNLPSDELGRLLREYSRRYGPSAAAYARATVPKWKSREVMLSGKTAIRLLDLVPPYLPSSVRYQLIRHLRTHCFGHSVARVSCEPHEWRSRLQPVIDNLVSRYSTQNLPAHVTSVATWLANNDGVAAQRLLAAAEQEEARIRTALLPQEFRRIEALIEAHDGRAVVSHTISLPQGNICVKIRRQSSGLLGRIADFFRSMLGDD
jgi:hypothetical protein